MARYFTATLLLQDTWPLDIDRIAAALIDRFPGVGHVDALPGQAAGQTGLLMIDNAQIVLQSTPTPVSIEDASPSLDILRTWDPSSALQSHTAQISITCGGRLPALEGAQAYAAATHFVATAAAGLTNPLAVLWGPARQLVEPSDFAVASETLLTGTMPLSSWIAYAPVVPEEEPSGLITGMVTYGLRPFIGHELELAPRPGDPRAAYRCMVAVVQRIMRDWLELSDGLRLVDRTAAIELMVRERRYWLRREESAYALIAEDSVVDPWTLRPRERSVA